MPFRHAYLICNFNLNHLEGHSYYESSMDYSFNFWKPITTLFTNYTLMLFTAFKIHVICLWVRIRVSFATVNGYQWKPCLCSPQSFDQSCSEGPPNHYLRKWYVTCIVIVYHCYWAFCGQCHCIENLYLCWFCDCLRWSMSFILEAVFMYFIIFPI